MKEELELNLENIIRVIKENVPDLQDVEIESDSELIASGYIESLVLINIIVNFESVFNVRIPVDTLDIGQFETPGEILKLLEVNKAVYSD